MTRAEEILRQVEAKDPNAKGKGKHSEFVHGGGYHGAFTAPKVKRSNTRIVSNPDGSTSLKPRRKFGKPKNKEEY